MNTQIVNINPDMLPDACASIVDKNKCSEQIDGAAALLRAGRLVAFPTETVYGLGADALNESAVKEIYEVKNRPSDNPLILHIGNIEQLDAIAEDVDEQAMALARRFWPGPLTMVFHKRGDLPFFATAGLDTVAVRMPSHPVARALLMAAGTPVAAPSANPSGKPSPTSGAHVMHDLSGKIDMIIDSGPVSIGLESTVLDVTRTPAVILRAGAITRGMIAEVVGSENVSRFPGAGGGSWGGSGKESRSGSGSGSGIGSGSDGRSGSGKESVSEISCSSGHGSDSSAARPKSPGIKYRHYAPDAPMLLFRGDAMPVASWMGLYLEQGCDKQNSGSRYDLPRMASAGILASDEVLARFGERLLKGIKTHSLGKAGDLETAAHKFYDALRKFDAIGVKKIFCELCGTEGIGAALADRMMRAAGSNIIDANEPIILFVCTGNTCRSAMAEALFNAEMKIGLLPARAISAGIYAAEGAAASFEAVDTMIRYNIDMSGHRAQQLDYWLLMRSSLTLTMTASHRDEILRRCPTMSERVFTLVEFVKNSCIDELPPTTEFPLLLQGEIDDPFGCGPEEYRQCADNLHQLISLLTRRLAM